MQAEVTLTQLDPIGEDIVIGIDLFGKLTDVFEPFLAVIALQTTGLMDDAVDERCDTADKGDFRPLLQIQTLGVLDAQSLYGKFLTTLLKQIVGDVLTGVLAVHMVEEPQREQKQHDGYHNGNHHQVQLPGRLVVLVGARLQLTVLTGGLLKVEIQVTVVIALRLIVDGGIGHAQLLTDGGHQVGGLIDE